MHFGADVLAAINEAQFTRLEQAIGQAGLSQLYSVCPNKVYHLKCCAYTLHADSAKQLQQQCKQLLRPRVERRNAAATWLRLRSDAIATAHAIAAALHHGIKVTEAQIKACFGRLCQAAARAK